MKPHFFFSSFVDIPDPAADISVVTNPIKTHSKIHLFINFYFMLFQIVLFLYIKIMING